MESDKRGLDPAEALAFYGGGRSELADRFVTPRWYHPGQGLALALFVASWGTHVLAVVAAAAALWLGAITALPRLYRRSTGVWLDARPTGESQRWARRLGWTTAVGIVLGILVAWLEGPLRLLSVVLAVAVFTAVQVFGRRFDEELREELRADPEIGLKVDEA